MSASLQATFGVQHVDSRRAGHLAIVTMDNGHDHTRPTVFGEAALRSLSDALDELEGTADLRGVMLTGKPFVFAVGADTSAFAGIDAPTARAGVELGHEQFDRLAALQVPTLAAINGACMGGGVEIALHCDARTISSSVSRVAFPEVFLSIVPGWGGTQLTPRLIGGPAALRLVVANALDDNRTIEAERAVELGLADRLVAPATFLDDSFELLEDMVLGELTFSREVDPADGLEEALEQTRAQVDQKVHGATPAPYRAVELIEFAALGGDLAEGRAREIDAMTELLPADQAQAAIYAFDLTQRRVKRQPWAPDAQPREIRKVAVVGAGLMGAQIGALFLQRYEVPVVLKDIDDDVLEQARTTVQDALDRRVSRGRLDDGKARFLTSLLTTTTSYDEVAGADVAIEVVLEEMDLKRQVLADLEEVLDPEAVLLTNTSSLSVAEMASGLDHPERVVGFHFFNPVAVMPLVEVVRPEGASEEAVATAFEIGTQLRKSTVQCADSPAFIVNRLLTRFNAAGLDAVRSGVPFSDVDAAYKQLGVPMGPFELFGFVGLEVAHHTAQTLARAFPDRFVDDDDLARIAELDVEGIYDWSAGGAVHDEVAAAVEVTPGATPMTGEQIRTAALEASADEIRTMLDDGTVADARDVDTGLLLGAGFPFFLGGLAKHLDQVGISEEVTGGELVGPQDRAG